MPKRKCFLDANIIISGLLWKGNERKLLDLGESREIILLTSAYVLREVEDVLRGMGFEETKVTEFLIYLRSLVKLVDVPKEYVKKYWDVLDDKKDVPVLAGAMKSKSILVTGDGGLLKKAGKLAIAKNAKMIIDEI